MRVHFHKIVILATWLAGIGAGTAALLNYQNAAGTAGTSPREWPALAPFRLAQDRATLLLFAHPKCPCSRATVGELNRLLARCPDQIDAHIYFLLPKGEAENWAHTDLWRSAAQIPGVTVNIDPEGSLARQFGAESSGMTLLYDARGKLLFRGGITAGRGHAGDNAGSDMIVARLQGPAKDFGHTPVFGCSLFEECDAQPKGES